MHAGLEALKQDQPNPNPRLSSALVLAQASLKCSTLACPLVMPRVGSGQERDYKHIADYGLFRVLSDVLRLLLPCRHMAPLYLKTIRHIPTPITLYASKGAAKT